ncbi:MAG TPA: aminotransferase [Cyanobacteria bacterium UBA8530]|nr:aminotransferase [Cyanobacteria bacterium UBA8530]
MKITFPPVSSPALRAIAAPAIAVVNEEADRLQKAGREVIRLGQAVPDLVPSPAVMEKVASALSQRFIHFYSPDPGLPELRQALAKKLATFNRFPVDPQRELLVTVGANQAFVQALIGLGERGAEVVLPSPYYMNHAMAVEMLGMTVVEVPLTEETSGYSLDPEMIEKALTSRTRAIVLVSPNNPTGTVFEPDSLRAVAEMACERGIAVISDEVYEYFCEKPYSLASEERFRQNVVTIGSFSKTFGMTGWRVGYMAASAELTEQFLKVHDSTVICAPVISQLAVLEALKQPMFFLEEYNRVLRERAAFLEGRISRIPGLQWRPSRGAMFAMVAVDHPLPSSELALDLLRRTGVATVPGSAFGKFGEGHLRISFGFADEDLLSKACDRLESYFSEGP